MKIFFSICFLVILTVLIIAIVNRKKRETFNEIIKNNIIKIIVICCMIFIALFIFYNLIDMFSYYDEESVDITISITIFTSIFLYVLSTIILVFNKKLSKNKVLIISTIIIYILIIIITPVSFIEGHYHNVKATPENVPQGMDEDDILYDFYAYSETFINYKTYYNLFGVELYTIEEK